MRPERIELSAKERERLKVLQQSKKCAPCARSKNQITHPHQNQIHPLSRSSAEETLEADISIWQKTGHFYFALTANSAKAGEASLPNGD